MEISRSNPSELELNPLQLLPIDIHLDHETVMDIDFKFNQLGAVYDVSRGMPIMKAVPFEAKIGDTIYHDCRTIFIQDDCMVVEYGQAERPDEINVMVVRQDIIERARPIQMILSDSITSSIDARDIIERFKSIDDLLCNLEVIIDRA